MPYQVQQLRGWRGVNFADDPSDVGLDQFVDGFNMELSDSGRLRARPGYAAYQSIAGVSVLRRFGVNLFASATNASYFVDLPSGTPTTLASGASGDQSYDFAANGVNDDVYSVNPARGLRKFAGAFLTLGAAIAGTPSGTLLATTALSDRLVCAGQSNRSRVSFSAPGDGTTWGSTDYIDLTPGDQRAVTALAVYSNDLYVFKPDKFFVFGPESTDSVGGVVFNYRMIDAGKGAIASQAAVGTPFGVFFVAIDGIYVTTGGPPEKVSGPIDPLFDWNAATDYSLGRVHAASGFTGMTFHQGRLWVTFSSAVLIFNPQDGSWLRWSIPEGVRSVLGDVARVGVAAQSLLYIGTPTALRVSAGSETDDAGSAITFSATSGWTDFGSDRTKVIRQAELRGTGSLNFEILTDRDYTSAPVAVTFPALGGNQKADGAWVRHASRGGEFAYRITSLSGRLDSLDLHLRDFRAEGEH